MNVMGLFEDGKKNGPRMVKMSISLEGRDTIGDIAEHSKLTVTQIKEIIKNKYMDVCVIELDSCTTIGDISRYCNYTVYELINLIQKDIINTDTVKDFPEKSQPLKRMTPEQETYILKFFEALRKQAYENGCSGCIMCDESRGCIDTSKQKLCDLLGGFFYEDK